MSIPTQQRQEIQGVHILKFICAILVVMCHIGFYGRGLVRPITFFGVPIFFMISGYFLVDSLGTISMQRLQKVFTKILKLTILANLFYLLFRMVASPSHAIEFCSNLVSLKSLAAFVCFGDKINFSYWYLWAYLQVLVGLMILKRLNLCSIVFVLAFVGLLFNLLCGRYSWVWMHASLPLSLTRSSIGIGLPCVALGMWLRANVNLMPSCKDIIKALIALSVVMYIEWFCMCKIFTTAGDILLTTVPMAFCLLYIAIKTPMRFPQWAIYCGKELSLYIYIFHTAIRPVIAYFLPSSWSYYGILLISTILLSIASAHLFVCLTKCKWNVRNLSLRILTN